VIRKKMIIDIISLILDVANQHNHVKGTSTTIMYRALFGQPELREFWNTLIKNDLLKFDPQTRTFKTTEKGVRFLHTYNQMVAVMNVKK
jgi:predicted transcriptional regulator